MIRFFYQICSGGDLTMKPRTAFGEPFRPLVCLYGYTAKGAKVHKSTNFPAECAMGQSSRSTEDVQRTKGREILFLSRVRYVSRR